MGERTSLGGLTLFVTGASRGIGAAIARRAAADGAHVVVAAKTETPHRVLPGTIHSVVAEIEADGGRALAVACDMRDEASVGAAVARTVEHFGGLDLLVNNAGAIRLTGTDDTPMRRFDLMHAVNVRGAFCCTQAALPHLRAAPHAHVLNLAPPLSLEPRWLAPHLAYTLSKYGMSLATLGWAAEFAEDTIAANALWPAKMIATAAMNLFGGDAVLPRCRRPEIMADAAHALLLRDPRTCTGRLLLDEDVLREAGVDDFERYAVEPGHELGDDLYVGDGPGPLG